MSCESAENDSEVFTFVGGESANDIFPNDPIGSALVGDSALFVEESTSLSSQPSTLASHGEVLAGASSEDESRKSDSICNESVTGYLAYVVIDVNAGVIAAKHRSCFGVDLATEGRRHASAHQPVIAAASSREQGPEDHDSPHRQPGQ
jgi:hypothetical protein